MRWFHTTVVAALAIIVLAFAIQNFQSTTISLLNLRLSAPLAVIVAVVYLLGMLTGGSVVSLIRWAVAEPGRR
jgi:putative membrane protein